MRGWDLESCRGQVGPLRRREDESSSPRLVYFPKGPLAGVGGSGGTLNLLLTDPLVFRLCLHSQRSSRLFERTHRRFGCRGHLPSCTFTPFFTSLAPSLHLKGRRGW